MKDRLQFKAVDQIQICLPGKPFQQHNGLLNSRFAQADGLIDTGHPEGVGLLQGMGNLDDAVAVSVGLDDRHQATVGSLLTGNVEIMLQGVEINDGPCCTGHAPGPSR